VVKTRSKLFQNLTQNRFSLLWYYIYMYMEYYIHMKYSVYVKDQDNKQPSCINQNLNLFS